MTTDRIKSYNEVTENVNGYNFVYLSICQGCTSLDYRFYNENKIRIKAHHCAYLSYSREVLKYCSCAECLVKTMCHEKNNCPMFQEFIKKASEKPKHKEWFHNVD